MTMAIMMIDDDDDGHDQNDDNDDAAHERFIIIIIIIIKIVIMIIHERFDEALLAGVVGEGVMGHLGSCYDRCLPDDQIINITTTR